MAEGQSDRAFVQFKSLEYGWRAAFYLLTRTYYHKYRLYTIRSIVSRWGALPPRHLISSLSRAAVGILFTQGVGGFCFAIILEKKP